MSIKRLYRRIRWLLFYQWKNLTLKQWPYESCKQCGKNLRISWSIKDKYWHKVLDRFDCGGGSYCVNCFVEIAKKKNICIHYDDFDYIELFMPCQKHIKSKCKRQ